MWHLKNSDLRQVRDSASPFRVLEKCQELCLRDRTATNNLVRPCTSFDFHPGSRIASFSGAAEYEESTCYLTREQAQPEGVGNIILVPNSVHFTEVCLACEYPRANRKRYRCAPHCINWYATRANEPLHRWKRKAGMISSWCRGEICDSLFSWSEWIKLHISNWIRKRRVSHW